MLKEKCAVVTGSTSGIGLALARTLAKQGCAVMLNGLGDPDEINAIRDEMIDAYGVTVAFSDADMTKPSEIAGLIADATRDLGRVDILVNNAGIQHIAPIEDFPAEQWDAILAINLTASFHSIQAVLPQMRERNWGRIINIASVHGLVASVNKAAYVAAKHGLVGLTKVVGLETAESGITCNAICPGWVRTPLVERQIQARAQQLNITPEEGARSLLAEKQPSKTFVTVEQLGQLAVFLCSAAASQITGTALPIDGGWSVQ